MQFVIKELRRYVLGWMNYFGISHTYATVLELDAWMRRRIRLYHWKQWTRSAVERVSRQAARRAERSGGIRPGARRRHLIRLGIDPGGVHLASRSRKGYWRMSQNSLVRFALNNAYLKEQGVPELREIWIRLHYGDQPKPKGTGKLAV